MPSHVVWCFRCGQVPRSDVVRCFRRNEKRFRGGLVCKAHRLVYHSTLGLRVIKKKEVISMWPGAEELRHLPCGVAFDFTGNGFKFYNNNKSRKFTTQHDLDE